MTITEQTPPEAPFAGRPNLLRERQRTHGSFAENARFSQKLKDIFSEGGYEKMSPVHREALDMIATKLSRILSGQHKHKDHWDDVAGYATLASEGSRD